MLKRVNVLATWSNILILSSLILWLLGGIGETSTLNFIFGVSTVFALINFWLSIIENEWHWKIIGFINRPLVKRYESREQNYKDVIARLESQLYKVDNKDQKVEIESPYLPKAKIEPVRVIGPTGSIWYTEDMEKVKNNA